MSTVAQDESALRGEELAVALAAVGVGVWRFDAATDLVVWSEDAIRRFGSPAGRHPRTLAEWQQWIHADDRGRVNAAFMDAIAAGTDDWHVEHRIDGEHPARWLRCHGHIFRDQEGKPLYLIGTMADVTDRREREARQALREQEYRLFTELANDYVYVVRWGSADLHPEIVAGSFERVTGYTTEEIRQRGGWLTVMHPDELAGAGAVAERLRAGERVITEYRIIARCGSVKVLRDRVTPIMSPQTGEPERLIGSVTDITEQRALSERLEHAQKLEAVARLAGGVAHDLNNLLTVVRTGVEALGENDRNTNPMHALTHTALDRATELVRSLLSFGRRQVFTPSRCDLGELVARALPLIERLFDSKVQVVLERDPTKPWISADPGQLQLALLNLAANARDAMPDGGTLTLRVSTRNLVSPDRVLAPELAAQASSRYAVLEVADTGTGMSPDVLAHMFEPFFTTKAQGRGTGLGLATTHGIVKQSGGCIGVQSRLGHGTTFVLYFPLAIDVPGDETPTHHTRESPDEAAPPATTAATKRAVLLVEDEDLVREILTLQLAAKGFAPRAFASAEAALALPDEELARFEVLVSDVRLPGRSGIELAHELARRRVALPTLLISGMIDDATERAIIADRRFAFLAKPFTPTQLATAIEATIGLRGGLRGHGVDTPEIGYQGGSAVS